MMPNLIGEEIFRLFFYYQTTPFFLPIHTLQQFRNQLRIRLDIISRIQYFCAVLLTSSVFHFILENIVIDSGVPYRVRIRIKFLFLQNESGSFGLKPCEEYHVSLSSGLKGLSHKIFNILGRYWIGLGQDENLCQFGNILRLFQFDCELFFFTRLV